MIKELLNSWERCSHCQNNFGNAVPRRSRWKRSLVHCSVDITIHHSQVHYVQKINFVQNLWRLAKLYIFEKLIMSGIRKLMFTFAQRPKWPPFWIFKMAAVKYEYWNILSFY